jgi:sulfur-carrier protein
MSKTVSIQYFAILRDEAGVSRENVETEAENLTELYLQLAEQYKFSLPVERLQVALNDDFCDWGSSFNEKDRVVFIPPVAGG